MHYRNAVCFGNAKVTIYQDMLFVQKLNVCFLKRLPDYFTCAT